MTQRTDVKKVLEAINSKELFSIPKNRRQRRSLNNRGKNDVSEVYSPKRISKVAGEQGLREGWAVDLTEVDPDDGMPWDFSVQEKRDKAKRKIDNDEPFMVILCPMCGPFSALQALFNYPKLESEEVRRKLEAATEHIRFSLELCLEQYRKGRLFMFEHPADATSWQLKCIQEMMQLEGVFTTPFDFCMLDMRTTDSEGKDVAAKKRTKIMTNSHALATMLREAQCRHEHQHGQLIGGRASACQVYPDKFAKLVCEAVRRELDTIRWRDQLCEVFDISQPFGRLMAAQLKLEQATVPEEDPFACLYEGSEFIDDVTGQHLDKAEAVAARKKEIQFFKQRGVYTKVQWEDWMKVITTKWLDINKGDEENKNYRARLVGREIAKTKRDDLFAATPPLESLRMILSICASHQASHKADDRFLVMSNDVKRAYFYAEASRPIFIKIPDEDWEPGDECRVGQLNLSLYGTRDAAMNWGKKVTEVMKNLGFVQGQASPCNYYHPGRQVSTTVHGDDFTSTGTEVNLKWLQAGLESAFEITTEFLGPSRARHMQEVRILNRVISWNEECLSYEADQRHAEIMIRELGLEGAKAVTTPGSRDDAGRSPLTSKEIGGPALDDEDPESRGPLLSPEDATAYRALVARGNYLAQDRVEIQYAVKEAALRMATPREEDWSLLKRIGRYLKGAPRLVYWYQFQNMPSKLDTFSDSDWAGCKTTRRSTSGGWP